MTEICEPKKAKQKQNLCKVKVSMHEKFYLTLTLCDTDQLLDQRLQAVLWLKQPQRTGLNLASCHTGC